MNDDRRIARLATARTFTSVHEAYQWASTAHNRTANLTTSERDRAVLMMEALADAVQAVANLLAAMKAAAHLRKGE